MSAPVPPRAERLLRWSLSPLERPAILGDLQEEHTALAQVKGAKSADQWYWRQVLRSIAPSLWRRLQADRRREARFRTGLWLVAGGVASVLPGLLFNSKVSLFWTCYGVLGAGQVVAALLHKRLDPPPRQRRVEKWLFVGIGVTWLVVANSGLISPNRFGWIVFGLMIALALWPRLPAEVGAEVRVQPKDGSDLGPPVWSLELPTESLGLSGLVLNRELHSTSLHAARLPQVTIQRTFAPSDRVRVRAAVNLAGREERASIELLDREGKQVWQAPTPLITGKLVEVPASLDDLADRDPADHFGLIDEALPLADLAPGSYRIRVTVANDIFQASSADEVITIAPSHQP